LNQDQDERSFNIIRGPIGTLSRDYINQELANEINSNINAQINQTINLNAPSSLISASNMGNI
jgi:hypothetical protein